MKGSPSESPRGRRRNRRRDRTRNRRRDRQGRDRRRDRPRNRRRDRRRDRTQNPLGIAGGIARGIAVGIADEIAVGSAFWIAVGIAGGIVVGSVVGIVGGIVVGSVVGSVVGIAVGSVVSGSSSGASSSRCFYHVVHPVFVWPNVHGSWYRFHPVAWDDLCAVPFPGLDRLLVAYAEHVTEAGAAEIERLIDTYPSQRMAALLARTRFIVREAGRSSGLTELGNVVAALPEGEKGFLRETSRLREMVGEIVHLQARLNAVDRPVFREPLCVLLRTEIENFQHRVSGFHEPLASEFRAAAAHWLAIADRQLQERQAVVQREPRPQVFRSGDPLTASGRPSCLATGSSASSSSRSCSARVVPASFSTAAAAWGSPRCYATSRVSCRRRSGRSLSQCNRPRRLSRSNPWSPCWASPSAVPGQAAAHPNLACKTLPACPACWRPATTPSGPKVDA